MARSETPGLRESVCSTSEPLGSAPPGHAQPVSVRASAERPSDADLAMRHLRESAEGEGLALDEDDGDWGAGAVERSNLKERTEKGNGGSLVETLLQRNMERRRDLVRHEGRVGEGRGGEVFLATSDKRYNLNGRKDEQEKGK